MKKPSLLQKSVAALGIGGVVWAIGLTLLALCCMFASIGIGSDTLTKLAGSLFALSRIGIIAAIVGGGLYAGLFVDWTGGADTKPEGGKIIDVTPEKTDHNTLD